MSRRRAMAVVAGVLLIVVGAAAIAGGVYVTQATPLEVGNAWAAPLIGRDTGFGYEGRKQYQVSYDADAEIAWGVEVRNPLAMPVTIRALRPAFTDIIPLVTGEELRLTQDGAASIEPADLRPFEPVELAPGERVFLVVREGFAPCEAAHSAWLPGGGAVRSTLPLEVAVAGVGRTVELELPFQILYSSPPGECPTP